jgi:hypothetical protein
MEMKHLKPVLAPQNNDLIMSASSDAQGTGETTHDEDHMPQSYPQLLKRTYSSSKASTASAARTNAVDCQCSKAFVPCKTSN